MTGSHSSNNNAPNNPLQARFTTKKFLLVFPNPNPTPWPGGRGPAAPCRPIKSREQIGLDYYSSDDTMDVSQLMNLEEERQDNEKNRCVKKLVDLCLSLMKQVIRLKDMIESSTMERRRAAAMPPPPQYSYTTALIDPFIRDIRQRQQQEQEQEEQRIGDDDDVGMFADNDEEESDCEDTIDCDCNDSRRVVSVDSMPPPLKRQKLQ